MAKRNAAKSPSRLLGLFLIIGGILLVSLSTAHNLLRLRSLRLDQATVQAYMDQQLVQEDVTAAYPTHIFIKWFVDTDIEPEVYLDNKWTTSPDKASYLVTSGKVGKGGNIVIYGHNTRAILGNIRALKGYETITLTTKDGSQHDYKIVSMNEVSPTDSKLVKPTEEESLTLYTCSGLMDSRRFIVRAKPVNQ